MWEQQKGKIIAALYKNGGRMLKKKLEKVNGYNWNANGLYVWKEYSGCHFLRQVMKKYELTGKKLFMLLSRSWKGIWSSFVESDLVGTSKKE